MSRGVAAGRHLGCDRRWRPALASLWRGRRGGGVGLREALATAAAELLASLVGEPARAAGQRDRRTAVATEAPALTVLGLAPRASHRRLPGGGRGGAATIGLPGAGGQDAEPRRLSSPTRRWMPDGGSGLGPPQDR